MRLGELHACPELDNRARPTVSTSSPTSSVSKTTSGSEPPSSSTLLVRFLPATSATAAPAPSLPVSETPWTRGSAIISAT